jgi:hypothetical protein
MNNEVKNAISYIEALTSIEFDPYNSYIFYNDIGLLFRKNPSIFINAYNTITVDGKVYTVNIKLFIAIVTCCSKLASHKLSDTLLKNVCDHFFGNFPVQLAVKSYNEGSDPLIDLLEKTITYFKGQIKVDELVTQKDITPIEYLISHNFIKSEDDLKNPSAISFLKAIVEDNVPENIYNYVKGLQIESESDLDTKGVLVTPSSNNVQQKPVTKKVKKINIFSENPEKVAEILVDVFENLAQLLTVFENELPAMTEEKGYLVDKEPLLNKINSVKTSCFEAQRVISNLAKGLE